ncbi:MAG: PepSY-like domain-containing protein [Alistipes sp.]|nr:PepSY-like domain-containing protein [Alistipes sp.]
MKKIILTTLFCVALFSFSASADDRAISVSKLPATAQSFLKTYYQGQDVVVATQDWGLFSTDYSVVLADGTKVEFDGNGEWESVAHKGANIPSNIIPSQIINYVHQHFPTATITKIERDRRGYEVEIANGVDLKFDTAFNCIEIDD